jgi:hypothetical protein
MLEDVEPAYDPEGGRQYKQDAQGRCGDTNQEQVSKPPLNNWR